MRQRQLADAFPSPSLAGQSPIRWAAAVRPSLAFGAPPAYHDHVSLQDFTPLPFRRLGHALASPGRRCWWLRSRVAAARRRRMDNAVQAVHFFRNESTWKDAAGPQDGAFPEAAERPRSGQRLRSAWPRRRLPDGPPSTSTRFVKLPSWVSWHALHGDSIRANAVETEGRCSPSRSLQ